jgi:hypothetical protein
MAGINGLENEDSDNLLQEPTTKEKIIGIGFYLQFCSFRYL